MLTLVLGGISSGKSRFAVELARTAGGRVLFVATGRASDPEMEARIAAHRRERPAEWAAIEAPLDLSSAAAAAREADVLLLDSVDSWVGNRMEEAGGAARSWSGRSRELEASCGADLEALLEPSRRLIAVSSEVGLSLVPATAYGRAFTDLLGGVNRRLAGLADAAYLVLAGMPVPLPRIPGSEP